MTPLLTRAHSVIFPPILLRQVLNFNLYLKLISAISVGRKRKTRRCGNLVQEAHGTVPTNTTVSSVDMKFTWEVSFKALCGCPESR